jgi:RimK family alpha-L-glutamate ligase
LEGAGLPVPPTWCGESAADAREAFERLGGDVVLKPLFGSEGRGLLRISDRETAGRVFHALERIGAVLYLQQFVPNPGQDLRLFVLGDQVLGAIRRHAPPGDWRANVAVGARAEPFVPDDAITSLALRAARAVGARVAGVDVLPARDGEMYVIEVNAVPGWRALAEVTGQDIAAAILADLRDGAGVSTARYVQPRLPEFTTGGGLSYQDAFAFHRGGRDAGKTHESVHDLGLVRITLEMDAAHPTHGRTV